MDSIAIIWLGGIFGMLCSLPSMLRFLGMHRVSNEVFLNLVYDNPHCHVIVKGAGMFTKAKHYILLFDGAQIYTHCFSALDLPDSVNVIASFYQHK